MKNCDKIYKVEIEKGFVSALKIDGTRMKLSRSQRNVLAAYRNPNYEKDIKKIFSNPDILSDAFIVVEDGEVRYRTYTAE